MSYVPVIAAFVVAALASCTTDAATTAVRSIDNVAQLRPIKGVVIAAVNGTTVSTTKADNSLEEPNFVVKNHTAISNFTDTEHAEDTEDTEGDEDDESSGDDDALSAVWYLAAFGGLVLFFFVVTCSELFMDNPIYTRRQVDLPHAGFLRRQVVDHRNPRGGNGKGPDTPPPPYHLFAPPNYDDTAVCKVGLDAPQFVTTDGNGKLARVYIVPVHGPGAYHGGAVVTEADLKTQLDAVFEPEAQTKCTI